MRELTTPGAYFAILPSPHQLALLLNDEKLRANSEGITELKCSSCPKWFVYSNEFFYFKDKRTGPILDKICKGCHKNYCKEYRAS